MAHLWNRLDGIQAVDWEAAINEHNESVTSTQCHGVLLCQLNEGIMVAVKTDLTAWQQKTLLVAGECNTAHSNEHDLNV